MNTVLLLIDSLSSYEPGDLIARMEIAEQCTQLLAENEIPENDREVVLTIQKIFSSQITKTVADDHELDLLPLLARLRDAVDEDFEEVPSGQVHADSENEDSTDTVIKKNEIEVLIAFIRDANDLMDGIEDKILQLESEFSSENINSIFRSVHTIKGTGAYLGFGKIKDLSHKLETMLDIFRKGEHIFESDTIDVLLESMDVLQEMIAYIENYAASFEDGENLIIPDQDIDVSPIVMKIDSIIREENISDNSCAAPEESKADMSFFTDLKIEFTDESLEYAEKIEADLLAIEEDPSQFDVYDRLFRSLHTLKGNTALMLSAMGNGAGQEHLLLTELKDSLHNAETMVQKKRDNKIALESFEIEQLLNLVDDIKVKVEYIHNAEISADEKPKKDGNEKSAAFINILTQSIKIIEEGIELVRNETGPGLELIERGVNNLHRLGNQLNHRVIIDESEKILSFLESTDKHELNDVLLFIASLENSLKNIKARWDRRGPASSKETGQPKPADKKTLGQTLKVSEERLDMMLNYVNELFVSKNNLINIQRKIHNSEFTKETIKNFELAVTNISKNTDNLQDCVMQIRLIPVNVLFSRFPRMVRDLSKQLGKKINLHIKGEETELDKNIIDALGDPMVHLVRNAIDHGIDCPAARKKQGKNETGTITLSAYNYGQHVCIEIHDDGQGIDVEIIKQSALAKKIVEPHELDKMDEKSILHLIFAPGFSTAENVSEVSGRGVGMDVVRTEIDKIGGSIDIHTNPGEGTRLVLKLPITLAINKGLEVGIGDEHYYIPLEYVEETIKIGSENVKKYKDKKVVLVRDRLLDTVDLHSFLSRKNNKNGHGEYKSMVILNVNDRRVALGIDTYYREIEYMLRPLPHLVKGLEIYSGVTITGSGEVVLVINPLRLVA